MRAIEVDIVDIHTNTLLKPSHRVLLANTTNECRKRGIGATGRLQGHIRHQLVEVGDIDRTDLFQLRAGERGDRQWHIEQGFLAPACGNHDLIELLGAGFVGRHRLRRVVIGSLRRGRQRNAQQRETYGGS